MITGYCPDCSAEMELDGYEAHTKNIIWKPCRTRDCKRKKIIKSSQQGYVLEPDFYKGRYIFARPLK